MLQCARGRLPRFMQRVDTISLANLLSCAVASAPLNSSHCSSQRKFYSLPIPSDRTGIICDVPISRNVGENPHLICLSSCSKAYHATVASFATDSHSSDDGAAESVEDQNNKILQCIKGKNVPPNVWIWSLIDSCKNEADIDLLFQTLEKLRKFKLSAVRINTNFNDHLCERVAEACARSNALEHGLKTLWKHNVYGLTPSIASAHRLLRHAKEKNDCKLMQEVIKVMQKNDLPLQSGTADLVFSICYNVNNWDLISVYSKRFINAGVRLHRNSYDTWMEFAADRGDTPSLWKIEDLHSKSVKQRSLSNAFSCAKGFLLDGSPESAATMILTIDQSLPNHKKPELEREFQKLIKDWPLKVVKRKKTGIKEVKNSLKKDIPLMVESLMKAGLQVMINADTRSITSSMVE